MKLERKLGEHV